MDAQAFTHCSRSTEALFAPQGKGGKTGYSFSSLSLKLDLFGQDGLTFLASLADMIIGLFFGTSGMPELGWTGGSVKPRRLVH